MIREMNEKFVRFLGKTWKSWSQLWNVKSIRRKILAVPLGFVGLFFIYSWTVESNSCVLNAFTGLLIFDVVTLLGDLLNQYYVHVLNGGNKTTATFSFGLIRFQILIHFVTVCFGLLYQLVTIRTFFTILSSNHEIHTGRFYPTLVIGGLIHFFISYNNPMTKIINSPANYTYLQKYTQNICSSFGLLSLNNPFIKNAFNILGYFIGFIVVMLSLILDSGLRWFDVAGGILVVLSIVDALAPICLYSSQVLLQTVPSHVVSQLEKVLREALTIDGVLEFRNELFWTLTYGQTAGTLHVRVRRDANEQLVLLKVYEKLQPLVSHLTIQITKDDFVQNFSSLQILNTLDNAPLTSITTMLNSTSSSMSPIPIAPGSKHLLYSNSSSIPKSKYSTVNMPSSSNDDEMSQRLDLSNTSIFTTVETPNVFTKYSSNSKYDGVKGQRENPFVMDMNSSSISSIGSYGQNSNILNTSTANYFPDD